MVATREEFRLQRSAEPREGAIAKMIEGHTVNIPSDTFLWAAMGSMAVSLILKANGRSNESLFVGQWAAPLLILGLYNKLVKVAGSECKS